MASSVSIKTQNHRQVCNEVRGKLRKTVHQIHHEKGQTAQEINLPKNVIAS